MARSLVRSVLLDRNTRNHYSDSSLLIVIVEVVGRKVSRWTPQLIMAGTWISKSHNLPPYQGRQPSKDGAS